MNRYVKIALMAVIGYSLPLLSQAQTTGISEGIGGLQSVLDDIYDQMIPQCSQLIGVGRAIAGFAALWYIAARVWRHIANAESIDFYPLMRPFAIGLAILNFNTLISVMYSVLQPTVTGTKLMLTNSTNAVAVLLDEKEKSYPEYKYFVGPTGNGDEKLWEQYSGDAGSGAFSGITNSFKFSMAKWYFNFKNSIKHLLSQILEILYEAAALTINTIRTFNLVILAILGPLVLGIAVFDGFQHTLTAWIARYLNVFLWLPVANIFGSIIANIQVNMLKLDIAQIQATGGTYFGPTDIGYLVFLIIGIAGYFTVPSIAGFIVNVGGAGNHTAKVSALGGMVAGRVMSGVKNIAGAPGNIMAGYNSSKSQRNPNSLASQSGRYQGTNQFQHDRLTGKYDNKDSSNKQS